MKPQTQGPTIKIVTDEYGYADPEVKRERQLAYLFRDEEEEEVKKFTVSSNTWGNKYHGDDGRFSSHDGTVQIAMVTGPSVVEFPLTDNIAELGPITGSIKIDKITYGTALELVTEMSFEDYSKKDDASKQNGISNALIKIKEIAMSALPVSDTYPIMATEVIIRSKDKKALAVFSTPDLMNSNNLRSQVISNAHYGDKFGKVKY